MKDGQDNEEASLPIGLPVPPDELPWRLTRAEETWRRLVAPYLAASIEVVLLDIVEATTDAERAICVGRLQAYRSMLQAPSDYEYLQARIDAFKERDKNANSSSGRRRSKRPVKRSK